ncbi:uncharacterized protein MICPUCDRAFT_57361 [Micromonas pusilla CCMP1545]|uniref:Predicted protein n=1 Tax=Micromonas pusilla (strain CCMP1545) TaxID=564608 RepID=C1MQP2_MICPC|nr:uncharacterized protein MICPUCDRAFT_57361 [Micromonas pusilla CCMP1545]EEH58110.1 predicted protein [Micromonas pusilla CCMP1545]|eukprot:XP_003058159.1 predicted protein [Micromonas pusilla CCMP1545]
MDNWTKIQANITKGVKEITDLFTSTGPDLPETDMEMCLEADRAYAEVAASSSSDRAAQDTARFRLAWALAHSKAAGHATRAIELLRDRTYEWGDAVLPRDRRYITAVAHFNEGDYLSAKEAATDALRHDRECRQAEALKTAAEEKIARDGVIGVGAVSVGAAVIGGLIGALASSSSRRR